MPALVLTRETLEKAVEHITKADRRMGILVRRISLESIPTKEPGHLIDDAQLFRALVRGIAYQLISVECGAAIMRRLYEACGGEGNTDAAAVLSLGQQRLGPGNVGFTTKKVTYVLSLAKEVAAGELTFAKLQGLSDRAVFSKLCALKGIGEWTAGVFCVHQLGRANVALYGDLTVRLALADMFDLHADDYGERATEMSDAASFGDTPRNRDILDAAVLDKCRPYRTVVTHLMYFYRENPEAFLIS